MVPGSLHHPEHMTQTDVGSMTALTAADLIILDSIFPHQYSGFRYAEYRAYLEHFGQSVVYSTGESIPLIDDNRELEDVIREFESDNPNLSNRVFPYAKNDRLQAKGLYFVFLAHFQTFADTISAAKAPFIFTLYPGGGLRLYDESCNRLLRQCFANPFFRKVIVTQPITREYLLDNHFVDEDQTELIPGMVVPDEFLLESPGDKLFYGEQKPTIDIAFIAHKYTYRGAEKGYDTFVEVAHRLSKHKTKPRFHVIGNFQASDLDVSNLTDSITFHGAVGTHELSQILSSMDMIISPNTPGMITKGVFDGFPTGSAIQAGLRGVAVFCTDELMQNLAFRDKKDIVMISSNAKDAAECVSSYLDKMDELYEIALSGRQTFKAYYGREAQLASRIKLLEAMLEAG
jgi:glycosyltransferase involved in cell wall biosynthesis